MNDKDLTLTNPKVEFSVFIEKFRSTLNELFGQRINQSATSVTRGIPPLLMRDVLKCKPLSVFIPEEYEGRGVQVKECLKMLETASYQSLPLGLMMGINGALFLQPVALYGQESIKKEVYHKFINQGNMGGLMITEPGYGSDALHMKTWYQENENGFRIKGTKHWAGLTGWADFWLLTARRKNENGDLARDIDFFVHRKQDNGIVVEEMYNNLGLYMLPYGRNVIDANLQSDSKLVPKTTGVKMMLDILHRSRLQFPGMGIGFVKRMMDEAITHCKDRLVGGKSLIDYDQVRERISKIQNAFTTCSAMCAYTSEKADMTTDLARADVQANVIKTMVTDYMHDAAQSLLQLVGAKGYRLDHIAGRSTVDSRPFQIFEGSNDILFQQVSESVLKSMRRAKVSNLYQYLKSYELSNEATSYVKKALDFEVDYTMSQRKLVELGKAISRVVSLNFVLDMGSKGFRSDFIQNSIVQLTQEINSHLNLYKGKVETDVIVEYGDESSWLEYVRS